MKKEMSICSIALLLVVSGFVGSASGNTLDWTAYDYLYEYALYGNTPENKYVAPVTAIYVNTLKNDMPGKIDGDYVACGATAEYIGGKLTDTAEHEISYNLYRKTGTNMMHVTVVDETIGVEFETVSPAFTDAYNENTGYNIEYRENYFDRQDEFTLVASYDTYIPIGNAFASGTGGVYTDTITDEIILDQSGDDSWLEDARGNMESTSVWDEYYVPSGSSSMCWWQ